MRARRSFRPALESMSSRITPSNLVPYDNPILAPVTIRVDDPAPPAPYPTDPVTIPVTPVDDPFVGDGNPPAFGEPTGPLFC